MDNFIYYKKDGSNGYTLDVTQVSDKAECEDLINDLNDEYGLNSIFFVHDLFESK